MCVADSIAHYRISRNKLTRERTLRRILRSEFQVRRRIGQSTTSLERRRETRHNLRVPIHIRPASTRGLSAWCEQDAPQWIAVTRNVSVGGLGFDHDLPLPASRLFVEFDVAAEEPVVLLVEVRWSVRQDEFAYRSGARILGVCRRGGVSRDSDHR